MVLWPKSYSESQLIRLVALVRHLLRMEASMPYQRQWRLRVGASNTSRRRITGALGF